MTMMRAISLLLLMSSSATAFVADRHCIRPTTTTALSARQEATFGMGCFWKPSEELLKVDGVQETIAGYTGVPNYNGKPPSYESVCFGRQWVEGVRVIYDDDQITYPQLLNEFWNKHEAKIGSRQYAAIIFPQNDQQSQQAQAWLQANDQTVRTSDGYPASLVQIEPASPFFRAENYHQDYWPKTRPRIAAMLMLLAISTGVLDPVTPVSLQFMVHTGANALTLAGLVGVVVERKFDTQVVEL